MFDELKKSISALLYERTTSPLFGTLVVSWSVWNWKIIYLTFFISENKLIGKNKIEYISENYNDNCNLYWFPLISTAILITLIPFISNGAYWISIKFLKWKKDKKNDVEMNQLLNIEQSIELREQIANQELKLSKIVEDKNLEIKQLNLLVNNLKNQSEVTNINQENVYSEKESELKVLAKRFKNNEDELKQFYSIISLIQSRYGLSAQNGADSKFVNLLESFDIIAPSENGTYKLLPNGKKLNKLLL
jgi:hypothetical protein